MVMEMRERKEVTKENRDRMRRRKIENGERKKEKGAKGEREIGDNTREERDRKVKEREAKEKVVRKVEKWRSTEAGEDEKQMDRREGKKLMRWRWTGISEMAKCIQLWEQRYMRWINRLVEDVTQSVVNGG